VLSVATAIDRHEEDSLCRCVGDSRHSRRRRRRLGSCHLVSCRDWCVADRSPRLQGRESVNELAKTVDLRAW